MIRLVHFKGWVRGEDDAVLVKRVRDGKTIILALPFWEDTPNIELSYSEALDLKHALSEVIGEIKSLPAPELFPETFISIADQSRLSALIDDYPSSSDTDRAARIALRKVFSLFGLRDGGHPY
ncbi:hypothetical protein [Paenibacillus sp. Marseille-Q4541]|uniref:hypothetical protein n=1 Tax=Paenibacillus sp. Marseille-Q4541 TaxID=2831522 RepID=UPI001BA86585|nr:hypothetical protein [Paenibacillus sp. Marseille-Q4541]